MNTRILDIIYTPLDLPTCPMIDYHEFLEWVKSVYPQDIGTRKIKTHAINWHTNYPWYTSWAFYNGTWQGNFDKLFPNMAKYVINDFGIKEEHIEAVMTLPIKENYNNDRLFWHIDSDKCGLRFYTFNTDYTLNPLLMRRFETPYTEITKESMKIDTIESRLQSDILTCLVPESNHPFYVNNYRAAHTPCISQFNNKTAFTIIVHPQYSDLYIDYMNELIIRSAIKFKDYALYWEPPVNSTMT